MTEIRGVISGTHPFSEQLIQQILDYKYGRADKSAVKNLFHKELTDLLSLQKENGFPITSNGSYGVEDLIRPFTRSLESVHSYKELGDLPIDRWHYTNTFYRKPELVNKFPDIPNVIKDDIHSLTDERTFSDKNYTDSSRVILPGPYTLIKLIKFNNKQIYPSIEDAVIAAGEYLSREIGDLPDNVVEIQFDDPYLVWERVLRNTRSSIQDAYSAIKKSTSRNLIVNTYFGDANPVFSLLLELPVDGIGIDFIETNLLSLSEYDLENKILQAGVIDSQNFVPDEKGELLVKNKKFLVNFVQSLYELQPKDILVSSNTGLDYLPQNIANQKIEQIGSLVDELKEEN